MGSISSCGRNPEAQESFVTVWLPKPSVFSVIVAQVGWFLWNSRVLGGSWENPERGKTSSSSTVSQWVSARSVIQAMSTVKVSQVWIETLDQSDAVKKKVKRVFLLQGEKSDTTHKEDHVGLSDVKRKLRWCKTPDLQP